MTLCTDDEKKRIFAHYGTFIISICSLWLGNETFIIYIIDVVFYDANEETRSLQPQPAIRQN